MLENNSANCFTVRAGGPLVDGVPVVTGIDISFQSGLPTLSCASWVHLPLESNVPLSESGGKHLVLRARSINQGGTVLITNAHPGWPGVLVCVRAQGLRFAFAPLARGLRLHAGADGLVKPLISVGASRQNRKVELYALNPGERVFVVDERAAVAVLTCMQGTVGVRQATATEIVTFMVERARLVNTVQCVDWARHNAERLRERRENRTPELLTGIMLLDRQRRRFG